MIHEKVDPRKVSQSFLASSTLVSAVSEPIIQITYQLAVGESFSYDLQWIWVVWDNVPWLVGRL